MRFLADGIDFPDELLWAQDDQRVVFFCGAGVSLAKANLPDFNGLTNQVLDNLGAGPENEARRLHEASQDVETRYNIRGLTSADRIFGQLRRDFTDDQIGRAVAHSLKPRDQVDVSAHKTMLRLATTPTGETRIITTNFDRLFEKSGKAIKTSTRSNLPSIEFSAPDWGIVYLHGNVETDYSSPTNDGLVLSSAEFGDAYLSRGWARDFIKTVLKNYIAVFVGYSADDPPVRYLLEGLQHSKGINRAFAFQSVPDDQAVVAWDEKGVTVVPFNANTPKGYDVLWGSLEEWARRTKNPRIWKERVISKARKGPKKLSPHERGMVAHLVRSADGARQFGQASPALTPEWLSVFDSFVRYGEPGSTDGRLSGSPKLDPHSIYKLDTDPPPRSGDQRDHRSGRRPEEVWSAFDFNNIDLQAVRDYNLSPIRGYHSNQVARPPQRLEHLLAWIIKTCDHPSCAWWAARQIALHPQILERVRWKLERSGSSRFSKPMRFAWQSIFEYDSTKSLDRDRGYGFKFPEANSGFKENAIREYASLFEPHLGIETTFKSAIPPTSKRGLRVKDIVAYDIQYPTGIFSVDVPDEYLPELVPRLTLSLRQAWNLKIRYSYWFDIVSIEEDEAREDEGSSDFQRGYKLSGHTLHYVALFRRLAELNPDIARNEIANWPSNSQLFTRLKVWAMGNLDLISPAQYVEYIISLKIDDFWPSRGNRDFLLGLKNRWEELSSTQRASIEKRILKGPKKFRDEDPDKLKQYHAYGVLNRIFWLKRNGCILLTDTDKLKDKLSPDVPDWTENNADNATRTHDGGEGMVRVDTNVGDISSMSPEKIIPHIKQLHTRPIGKLVEYDPFLGLSAENPPLALKALELASKANEFPDKYWSKFLRTDPRQNDDAKFTLSIAKVISRLSQAGFFEIIHVASSWFESTGPIINSSDPEMFSTVWNKFVKALDDNGSSGKSALVRQQDEEPMPDWVSEAINSPAGNLAQYLDRHRGKDQFERHEGLPEDWKQRAEQLLSLQGNSRRYTLAVLCYNLNYLFFIDPAWTKKHLLSVLSDDPPDQFDQQAFWSGFFWAARTPNIELYRLLKGHLTKLAQNQELAKRRFVENLSGILLAGWISVVGKKKERLIKSEELRAIILEANGEFRRHILINLDNFSKDENWSNQVVPFLKEVWPKQKSLRTREISSRLVELAFSQKQNFPEVVNVVCDLVTTVDDQRLFVPELRKGGETIAAEHPDETLKLLHKVLPENPALWPYGADQAIQKIGQIKPSLKARPEYIELESRFM